MKNTVVCISGTPGTGKSEIAKELENLLGANVISVNSLLRKGYIICEWDVKRKTKVVNVKEAERAARKCMKMGINIIDSHYSHLMKCDLLVILRTRPDILLKRLEKRRWNRAKIYENVLSEILGEIFIESTGKKNIIEIDTSCRRPKEAVRIIKSSLNNHSMQMKYRPKIEWTIKYTKLLLKMGSV